MRALVLSSVFPNPRQPTLGVFVRERVRRVAHRCPLEVVAPIPWFPGNRLLRGPRYAGIPTVEWQDGLRVHHPRFFCVPRYGKWLDGLHYALSLAPVLARLRRRWSFDLIDAHFAYPDGLAAVLLGRLFRRPVSVTLRGSIVRLSRSAPHRPQLRWVLRQAAGVVAVSESLRRLALDLGAPPDGVRVIPNGVDARRFSPRGRREARAACGLPADRPVLLTVATLCEGKGQHHVVDVLPDLLARHPDLLYVMVGEPERGPYARDLQEAVRRRGLAGHVHFAGPRLPEELSDWYSAADLFCLATRSEGWANVLLEALACGVPIVTTRVGGNPEVVRDGRDGILVAPGDRGALRDALLAGLSRPWDRDAMVAYGRAHTWEAAADAVVSEFERLVGGGGAGRAATAVAEVGR